MRAGLQICKERLPRGWGYALKPSLLEEAMASAGIRLTVSLRQCHKAWAVKQPALCAKFYPSGSFLGGEVGSVGVWSYAVPSNQLLTAQKFAEFTFIPAWVSWVLSIEELPESSTVRREEQGFHCENCPEALSKRPLPWIAKGQPRKR